jgi:formylglycine-generating enzyme required for sulfatase activity
MYQRPYATARGDAKAKAGETLIEALRVVADAQVAAEDCEGAGATLKQALTVATTIKSESKAALLAQLAGLAPKQQIEKQIAGVKAKLDADPKDESSRKEIVRLYLVEMNNPAEAAGFVDESLDEATRKFVPAATKPLEETPELACNELGDWYRGLADQATAPASKGAMLQHAKAYYQRFLDLHTADDLARIGATLMIKKVDDALAKVTPVAESKPSKTSKTSKSSPSGPPLLTLDLGNNVTLKLVCIPAGKFIMGSPDTEQGRQAIEGPQHAVTITKPFYMGVTEVTEEQYETVVGRNPSQFMGPTNPVNTLCWDDAIAFCSTLSEKTHKTVRLPTEAEWEYACRAGSTTRFSFGDSDNALDEYAWYTGNWAGTIHPVGQKKPNAWGLYDMHGNVWEWCQDWFGAYAARAVTDPGGPSSGSGCVVRGGSANSYPHLCHSAARREHSKGDRYLNVGFRVCLDLN